MSAMKFDAPSVEELTKRPLAKCITFATNDCCYHGSTEYLIVNLVHSLILKAKAAVSKEDDPNW